LDFRHAGGERACRVFRTAGNPNDLTLLFDWKNLEQAKNYMNSEELHKKMKQASCWGSRPPLPGGHVFDSPQRGRLKF